MISNEKLAFLKANRDEMSGLFCLIEGGYRLGEEKSDAEAAAKAKVSGGRPTRQASGRQPSSAREKTSVSHIPPPPPRAAAGKRMAKDLGSSDLGCSVEPANRHPAPWPLWPSRENKSRPEAGN
jgi:hypothetical protein